MPKTQRVEPDWKERSEGFMKKYEQLVVEYDVAVASYAFLSKDGRVMSECVYVSTRDHSDEEKEEAPKITEG